MHPWRACAERVPPVQRRRHPDAAGFRCSLAPWGCTLVPGARRARRAHLCGRNSCSRTLLFAGRMPPRGAHKSTDGRKGTLAEDTCRQERAAWQGAPPEPGAGGALAPYLGLSPSESSLRAATICGGAIVPEQSAIIVIRLVRQCRCGRAPRMQVAHMRQGVRCTVAMPGEQAWLARAQTPALACAPPDRTDHASPLRRCSAGHAGCQACQRALRRYVLASKSKRIRADDSAALRGRTRVVAAAAAAA